MNRLEYYDRQQDSWEKEEVDSLTSEYETKEMTIRDIADIHRRTPGSISYKLKSMGLITHSAMSRGYIEYIQSELYQEIVETGKRTDAERKVKKEATLNMKAVADAEKREFNEAGIQQKEETSVKKRERRKTAAETTATAEHTVVYTELKREIIDLKKDVKEMLRLIHELYDFESQ